MNRSIIHFNEKVIELKYKLKINKDDYLNKTNYNSFLHHGFKYSEEEFERKKIDAGKNYDINMDYYKTLDINEFNEEVNKFIDKYENLEEIKDLSKLKGFRGLYLMVLDEYKQVYIGQSSDIRKRIRQHWVARKPMDRLVFGGIENSKISIDSLYIFTVGGKFE